MTETPALGSQPPAPNDASAWNDLLDQLTAVRGVEAAAIVGVDGEFLEGRAVDDTLLERMVSTVTSALAAGEALAGLLEAPTASSPATAVGTDHDEVAGDALEARVAHDEAGAVDDGDAADDGDAHGAGATHYAGDAPNALDAGIGRDAANVREAGSAQHQLMVMYQDGGPILFTPLANGECVAVVALGSSHDIGRVRFRLRGLAAAGGRL